MASSADAATTLFVVSELAHNRMLAWPGGGAANMEVPARLVSARNAIHMLPPAVVREVDDVLNLSSREQDDPPPWWSTLETDLSRAHTHGFVEDVRTQFFAEDPEMMASLTAVTSVLAISDQVVSPSTLGHAGGFTSGLALVRPAGHHSTPDRRAPLCVINSVMVAALREAHSKGKVVGVLDVDVHFATGSQKIALRWNEQQEAGEGRVIVADVYGAMGPPARFVEKVQLYYAEVQRQGLDAASLRAEMDAEFASAKPHEREVIDMICDSHLLFPYGVEELNDDALLEATTHSVEHFVKHGVETIFISLGLDAAAGDREGAQVHPEGFKKMAQVLRKSGLKLIFALEGGYHVGDLDGGDIKSSGEGVEELDVNRFLGTGNFGRCLHAVASILAE
eukprot:gene28543-35400_t